TSKKFHDLVLNLRLQNSRVLETIVFQALFSRRKVSIEDWIIHLLDLYERTVCKRSPNLVLTNYFI
ncbi:hypothetical protein, partial [Streptococcus sp. HMSC072G04]|uniref:hypothetical protein n=1 Tax=Streptococcus sp. HMSC072G04 TaxID=1739408 RepID=UPI001C40437A